MNDRIPNWLHWTILGLAATCTALFFAALFFAAPLLLCLAVSGITKPN